MNSFVFLLIGILVLGLIIIVHELGHFIFCRIFDVKVLRFSVGFGPAIWRRKIGETEYRISAIPLGGYVAPLDRDRINEIETFMKRAYEKLVSEGYSSETVREALNEYIFKEYGVTEFDLKNRTIESKPFFAKFLIVFGGPLFNFLLGILAMYFILVLGRVEIGTRVQKVLENSPAQHSGIVPGDEIVEVNGNPVRTWGELKAFISFSKEDKLTIKVKRGDKFFPVSITTVEKDGARIIGVFPDPNSSVVIRYGFIQAIPMSFFETMRFFKLILLSFKMIFSKEGLESLGGPIAITKITASAAQKGVEQLLLAIFVITMNLGILNLIPIPVLDGGHILIFSIEGILRRRLSQGVRQAVTLAGLFIILSLLLIAMWNDIRGVIGNKF